MWPKEIKKVVTEKVAKEIWESVITYGHAFIDLPQAKKIVLLVENKSKQALPVDEVLKDWTSRSKRTGYYGYKTFIQSFSTSDDENPFKNIPKSSRLTPQLREAVLNKDEKSVRKLLLLGADPNHKPKETDSILYQALDQISIPIIKMLLQAGADQNYAHVDEGCHHSTHTSCFQKAVDSSNDENDPALLSLFLKYGGDPNKITKNYFGGMRSDGSESFTPLHTAIKSKNPGSVEALLEVGADPNLYHHYFYSNEYGSRQNSKTPCIALAFLERGQESSSATRIKIMKLLLQYGEDIDQRYHYLEETRVAPSQGRDPRQRGYVSGLVHYPCIATTLHMAVKANDLDIIKFLVMSGANTHIPFLKENKEIPILELCKSKEATNSLACEFESMYFANLPPEIQAYILSLMLTERKRELPVPSEINSIIFTYLIHLYWYKKSLTLTYPTPNQEEDPYGEE